VLPAGVAHLLVFGTARNADIRVRDPYVSPHHCAAMQMDDGRVFVTDLGSPNGTWLTRPDGRRGRVLGQTEIHLGDVLTIGHTHMPWLPPEET
jgi:pSer/pThr/pTyr-binding forkhead associated (FHA) protein